MSAVPALNNIKRITMEVGTGPHKGQTFHLAKPLISIGRGTENDLVFENDSKISRNHIEIRQTQGLISIHNITEKNTALFNGQLIKDATLNGSARLLIGDTEIYIHLDDNQLAVQSNPSQFPVPNLHLAPSMPASVPMGQSKVAFPSPAPRMQSQGNSPKLLIYLLLGIGIMAGAYVTSQTVAKHRRSLQIKSTEEVEAEVKLSTDTAEEITKKFEEQGVDSRGYQTAQQQYVRGYRDYNQGQYGRAIHELSAAITYYPQHKLAQRYLALAQKKLDELVKAEFQLGQKYRGQQSYRRCSASFKKVITLLDDPEDQTSKDAEKIMQECDLQQREHY